MNDSPAVAACLRLSRLRSLLYEVQLPRCLIVLIAGLAAVPPALGDQGAPYGANASYSYSGFFSDFQNPMVPISKSDAVSTIGRHGFLPVAVGDESNFTGPLGTTASATAAAHASSGTLGVSITGQVDAVQARSSASLKVDAKASLFDILTIGTKAPGNAGKTYHLTNEMKLDGSSRHQITYAFPPYYPLKGNDYVSAGMDTQLKISGIGIAPGPYLGGLYEFIADSAVPTGFISTDDRAPATITFAMDFTVGQPTPVFLSMEIGGDLLVQDFDALTHFPGRASFIEDFSHTLSWGPATTVTDVATGQVIKDWTMTSISGFNYGSPVPEPSYALLLGGGAILLTIWRGQCARAEPIESAQRRRVRRRLEPMGSAASLPTHLPKHHPAHSTNSDHRCVCAIASFCNRAQDMVMAGLYSCAMLSTALCGQLC